METSKHISKVILSVNFGLLILIGGLMIINTFTRRSDEYAIKKAELELVQENKRIDACVSVGGRWTSDDTCRSNN